MKLKLKTLTPVHISTGNEYEALDYINHNGIIHKIHLDKALEIITTVHPDAPSKFADWVEVKIFRTENAGQQGGEERNKEQSRIKSETNLAEFCRKKLQDESLIQTVIDGATLYSVPAPFGLGKDTKINAQFKDSSSLPYIPGSSLKGAIKTALAANAWGKYPEKERAEVLKKAKKTGDRGKISYKDEPLNEMLFSCKATGIVKYDAARFNVMKFFHISDVHLVPGYEANSLEVFPVFLYIRDKEPQPQTIPQEVIPEGSFLEFEFSVDVDGLTRALAESRKPEGMWRGFETKIERLFNVKIGSVSKNELERSLFKGLLGVLADQSSKALRKEMEWLRDLRYSTGKNGLAKEVIKNIYDYYESTIPNTEGTIKLGWGSGFLSTTLFAVLLNTDRPYLEEMFKDTGIGVPRVKGKNFDPPNLENFPKSKRLTAKSLSIPESILGWVKIGSDLKVEPRKPREIQADPTTEEVVVPLTPEEQMAKLKEANEKLKLKDTINMAAVVTGSETPFVLCRILHKDLETETFRAKYAAGLSVNSLVLLKVTFQKPGRVQTVTYLKSL